MNGRGRIWVMLTPVLAVILCLYLGGLFLGLLQSLNYMPLIGQTQPNLEAYRTIFGQAEFWRSLTLTLEVALGATVISTLLAVACALTLRRTFRGRQLITFVFQLNLPIPHLVGGVAIVMLFTQSGLVARLARVLGLIESPSDFPALVFDPHGIGIMLEYVWKETVFIGVILLAVLHSLGTEYEELAASLGANPWQRFRYVLLPLMMPGILSASMIVFAFSFGAFEIPLLLGASHPVTLPVVAYRAYTDVDLDSRSQAMALSMVITVIITLLTYGYMRLSRAYVRAR
jgi:putative spermidine/putrescine transport system permease protein